MISDEKDLNNIEHNEHNKSFKYYSHIYDETVEMKKSWYHFVLASIEKLHDSVDDIRRIDIERVKQDLKERINKVEKRTEDLERDSIIPLRDKVNVIENAVTGLKVKYGFIGVVAGIIFASAANFAVWAIQKFFQ
jgi:DNA-binding transcriptional MerR regulator